MNRIERLTSLTPEQAEELIALWEASVRSTHHFLTEADIVQLRPEVGEALPNVDLYAVRDAAGFAAFMGIASRKLEMLFVRPDRIGKGLGSRLVDYAIEQLDVCAVDVNEQNPRAARFYARRGFRLAGRTAHDSAGRAFPILHLERA